MFLGIIVSNWISIFHSISTSRNPTRKHANKQTKTSGDIEVKPTGLSWSWFNQSIHKPLSINHKHFSTFSYFLWFSFLVLQNTKTPFRSSRKTTDTIFYDFPSVQRCFRFKEVFENDWKAGSDSDFPLHRISTKAKSTRHTTRLANSLSIQSVRLPIQQRLKKLHSREISCSLWLVAFCSEAEENKFVCVCERWDCFLNVC